jgi:hypothetical protein
MGQSVPVPDLGAVGRAQPVDDTTLGQGSMPDCSGHTDVEIWREVDWVVRHKFRFAFLGLRVGSKQEQCS